MKLNFEEMIKEFVQAWDARKDILRHYIESTDQRQYETYEELTKALFSLVVNPWREENGEYVFDVNNLHMIDDGEYQGTQLFVIPFDTYQPSSYQYVITFQEYGSCSGCDMLQGIQSEGESYRGLPTTGQVDQYMTLLLHLLQRCKFPFDYND